MALKKNTVKLIALLTASTLVMPAASIAGGAGRFQFVTGDVRIRNAQGGETPARKGVEISEGDTIVAGKPALAQVVMSDGGVIVVRPDTVIAVATYRYEGRQDGNERATFDLTRGSVRAITGAVGQTNKQNYLIRTPTANIGVRGTDHEPAYIADGDIDPASGAHAGTYDKVNLGSTYIANDKGKVVVAPNTVGFAEPGRAPVRLAAIPEFMRRMSPGQTGAPANGGDKGNAGGNGKSGTTRVAASVPTSSTANAPPASDATPISPEATESAAFMETSQTEQNQASQNGTSATTAPPTAQTPTFGSRAPDPVPQINQVTQIQIVSNATPTPAPVPTPVVTPTPAPTPTPTPLPTPTPTPPPPKVKATDAIIVYTTQPSTPGAAPVVHLDRIALQTTLLGNQSGLNDGRRQEGGTITDGAGTTVNWGRWTGGYPIQGVTDPQTGYFHYVQIGPAVDVQLPLSGTFTYRLGGGNENAARGTSPTMGLNQVGNLTGLTVSVDFTSAKVTQYDMSATVGGNVWRAGLDPNGSSKLADFTQTKGIGLVGTCQGCIGSGQTSAASGAALGQFYGKTGQGLITGYGLQSQGSTLSGTAILRVR